MNKTKTQIATWSAKQRAKYRRGLLSKSEIKELESIPNWNWGHEDRVVKTAHKVFKRAKIRGSLPKCDREDSVEGRDGRWINAKKQAKKKSRPQ